MSILEIPIHLSMKFTMTLSIPNSMGLVQGRPIDEERGFIITGKDNQLKRSVGHVLLSNKSEGNFVTK